MQLQRPSQEAWDEFTEVHSKVEKTPSTIGVKALDRGLHGAMGLAGESGEVLELFKKFIFEYKHPNIFQSERLIDELGDLVWYLALVLDSQAISFDEVLRHNAAKLRARHQDRFDSVASNSVRDA
jgi:NTP pyrophosphatase (non-canonical NTP hydrolase)